MSAPQHGVRPISHETRQGWTDLERELVEALDQCRAIIKFHVKDSGVCCTLSGSDKPFSALQAFQAAVSALAKARGDA